MKTLISEFKKEVEKNFLLAQENRQFLLSNAHLLPEKVLKELLKSLKEQNKKAKKYIELAVDNEPTLAMEMKTKARTVKQKIQELSESEEKGELEKGLEEELKKT